LIKSTVWIPSVCVGVVDVDEERTLVAVDRAAVVEVVAAFLTDVATGEQEASRAAIPTEMMTMTRRVIFTIPFTS